MTTKAQKEALAAARAAKQTQADEAAYASAQAKLKADADAYVENVAAHQARDAKLAQEAQAKTISDVEFEEIPKPVFQASSAPINEEDMINDFIRAATEGTMLDPEIGIKRKIISLIVALTTSFGTGYIGGTLTLHLLVGTAVLTGSLFWTWVVTILGILTSIYLGMKIGSYAGNYILSSHIDRDWATVKSWFTSKPKVESKPGFFKKADGSSWYGTQSA